MRNKYYAVRNGRETGIFRTWEECKAQVDKFPRAVFKSFSSEVEASNFARPQQSWQAPPPQRHPEISAAARLGARDAAVAPLHRPIPVRHVPVARTPTATAAPVRQHSSAPPTHGHRGVVAPPPASPEEVYVDGSCFHNGRGAQARGGYGGWYGHADPRNFSMPLLPTERQTNNRGELKAAIHAVARSVDSRLDRPLQINTDSEYCVKGINSWIAKWRTTNYKGVENADLWKELDSLVSQRREQYVSMGRNPLDAVTFRHVPGHAGVVGNEMADQLAKEGSKKASSR